VSEDVSIPYLVIVTGPSRAGKTSLAAELSKALPSRPLHIEADAYLPKAYVDDSWYAANQERLALALHRSVLPWIQAGYSVILDGSLPQAPELIRRCLQIFDGVPQVIVGVVCPPDELTRRAVATGRSPSWSLHTLSTFGTGIELSVRVDTCELTLAQCIQRVAACLPTSSSTTT
jgi:chloramphenicol 3-O phosphotransferase